MGREPKIEQVGVLRTNSKHKKGFEFWIDDLSERRRKLMNCLHWISYDAESTLEPTFPAPMREALSLTEPCALNRFSQKSIFQEGNGVVE
jgi:hypothetical protein